MPLAALFVVQATSFISIMINQSVSMPLAALFVVQAQRRRPFRSWKGCFNAARGFVCGASAFH